MPSASGQASIDCRGLRQTAIDRVTAGKPVRKTLKLITTQPGRIEAFEERRSIPSWPATFNKCSSILATRFKKDQLLIKLSIPEMLDEVKQMEALVAQADAEVSQAEAAVKSAEAAAERGGSQGRTSKSRGRSRGR